MMFKRIYKLGGGETKGQRSSQEGLEEGVKVVLCAKALNIQ